MKAKRLVSILLVCTMLIGLLPMSVFAAKGENDKLDEDGILTVSNTGVTSNSDDSGDDPGGEATDEPGGDSEILAEGRFGSGLAFSWTFTEGGTLTISGSGEMPDISEEYDEDTGESIFEWPWDEWKNGVRAVVIENGITGIGAHAFYQHANLERASIPDTVTSIGSYAFAETKLRGDLTISDHVTSLGTGAFNQCSQLTSVTMGTGLTAIPDEAFFWCEGLEDLTIGENVTTIGEDAFYQCHCLTHVDIPDHVTTIKRYAFEYSNGLRSVSIGAGVSSIAANSFLGCEALESFTVDEKNSTYAAVDGVLYNKDLTSLITCPCGMSGNYTIPAGVTDIQNGAFANCSKLTSITISAGVSSVDPSAFNGCESVAAYQVEEGNPTYSAVDGILFSKDQKTLIRCPVGKTGDFTVPTGVTTIEDNAFSGCKGLTSVTILDSVTAIGEHAFEWCSSLTTAEIGAGVTEIPSYCFSSCSNLKSVTFGPSVTHICSYAFSWTGLTDIYYGGTAAQWGEIGIDQWNYDLPNVEIHTSDNVEIPSASGTCGDDLTWSLSRSGVLTIRGTGDMYDVAVITDEDIYVESPWDTYKVRSVVIESGVTGIGDNAFYDCGNLTSVTIGSDVRTIGENAFENTAIEEIHFLGTTVPTASDIEYLFAVDSLQTIYVPAEAFDAYTERYSQYLPDGAQIVAEGSEVPQDGDFIIQNGVLTEYHGAGGDVIIPDTVTEIGMGVFFNNTSLTSVTIPEGVTIIGDEAFSGCTGLTGTLTIPEGVHSIGRYAFYGCSGLTGTLSLPEGLETIGTSAFEGCTGFSGTLLIPEPVERLESNLFVGMDQITSVVIGSSVNYIYCYADYGPFMGMSGVREVTFLGNTVPALSNGFNPLEPMVNLEKIYVPAEVFQDYVTTYWLQKMPGVRVYPIGANESDEFVIEDGVLVTYLGSGGDVVIPDTVREIGTSAFQNCTSLTHVTIPESVTRISDYAFRGCTGLAEISLPAQLEYIGALAFYCCSGMTGQLVIPDSVTFLGASAFNECSGLTGLTLGNGITVIEETTFANCTGFTGELVIPDSVTRTGYYAFWNCSGFTGQLVLPEHLTEVDCSFSGCSGFSGALVIPDSVTTLHNSDFSGMDKITSIEFGSGINEINAWGSGPFYGMTGVTELYFKGNPPTMTGSNSGNAFKAMQNLKDVYVTPEAYDAFVAFQGNFPDGTVIHGDNWKAAVADLKAEKVYSRTAELTWAESFGDEIVGYHVYRDGALLGTTTTCSYLDRTLEPGVSHTYTVTGFMDNGRESDPAAVEVTAAEPRVTGIETENGLDKIGLESNTITIYVADSGNLQPLDEERTTGMLYYVSESGRVLIGEATLDAEQSENGVGVYTVPWDLTDVADGSYALTFVLTDVDGSSAEFGKIVTVDTRIPDPIIGVVALADETSIHITWSISTEVDTDIYRIYRSNDPEQDFTLLKEIVGRNTLSYTDQAVEKDQVYYYYVVGVSSMGVESASHDVVGAALINDTAAPAVTRLTPTSGSWISGRKDITLHAEDNVSVIKSSLYYSLDQGETWTLLGEGTGADMSAALDTTAFQDGEIRVKGVAEDAAGNVSDPLIYAYSIDNTGPGRVEGLSYESTSVSVTLKWNNAADDDVQYFRVERLQEDGTYTQVQDVFSTLGVNLYGLSPETSYTYRVVAYDLRGNRGVPSEDLTVTTTADVSAPVITSIRPLSGYYNYGIPVTIQAEDDFGVRRITLQTSSDGILWSDVTSVEFDSQNRKQSLSYNLSTEACEDGLLYVRGVAADFAGNESDTGDTAPFVQHMVDKTAPAAPEQVTANGSLGNIEISWVQGPEEDLDGYSVWRKTADSDKFVMIASGLQSLNYFDREVTAGETYQYYVTVSDVAGNVSPASETVSAVPMNDEEAPKIVSVYPASGERVGMDYRALSILAVDNLCLGQVDVEISGDGEHFLPFYTTGIAETYCTTVNVTLPLDGFSHGDTIYIRTRAHDQAGNVSEDVISSYLIDLEAPGVSSAIAAYDDGGVPIRWDGGQEADLLGYRIYRRAASDSSYTLVAQRQAAAGQTVYSCVDYSISLIGSEYVYKIEAVDQCGNVSSMETNAVLTPDRSAPMPNLSCESVMEVGVEYAVDATGSTDNTGIASYHIDFGDGTKSTLPTPVHVYSAVGSYTITLTVTDDDGNSSDYHKQITVKERTMIGTVRVPIVDESGQNVPAAPVYFDLGSDSQVVRRTDGSGYVTFTADVGRHVVGSVIADNEWLPVKKEIIVTAGETTSVTMTLIHQTMIEGEFEITRMTFDEIQAAGISTAAAENQHIVRVNAHLTYSSEKINTSFYYNASTGKTISKPIIVTTSSGEKREITPIVIGGGGGGGGGGTGGGMGWGWGTNPDITIAYLDIPVEASFLKEFFDVKLHIINNAASTFRMDDNVITLNVPDGLSVVPTDHSAGSAVVSVPEIAGQSTETITWILRGDVAGDYPITADFSGTLAEFNEPIYTKFESSEPIHVYGLDALKLVIEVNSIILYDGFYFNVSVQNKADADMYLPKIDIVGDAITTYLEKLKTGEVTDPRDVSVHLINRTLTNESGYSQPIGVSQDVTTLSKGMTLTSKYAVYGATTYNDILYFQDAVKEVTRGYGADVEIRSTDMDLYSVENAMEKIQAINDDLTKDAFYRDITLGSNFMYVRQSLDADGDLKIVVAEQLYQLKEIFTKFDFTSSLEQMRKQVRQVVTKLMVDESMQTAVELNLSTKQFKLLADIVKMASTFLSGQGDTANAKLLSDYAASEEKMISSTKKIFGLTGSDASFEEKLVLVLVDAGLSKTGQELLRAYFGTSDFQLAEMKSLGKFTSGLGDFLTWGANVVEAIQDSIQLQNDLLQISASFEEANVLLDMLIQNTEFNPEIHDAVKRLKDDLSDIQQAKLDKLKDRLAEVAMQMVGKEMYQKILPDAFASIYGVNVGPYIIIARALLEIADYVFDWSGQIEDLHMLRVLTELSYALSDAVADYGLDPQNEEEAVHTLKALKYLIKMRMIGELGFADINADKDESVKQEYLNTINSHLKSNYQSLDEYANDTLARMLRYRDAIFSSYYETLDIPEAPTVTVNYLTNQTNESFGSEYEYSFDGTNWLPCSGPISFEPGSVAQHLRVRIAETENSYTGNVGSAVIRGMPRLQGDFETTYDGTNYIIRGLQPGAAYFYGFANDRDNPVSLQKTVADSSGVLHLPSSTSWVFVVLKAPATSTSPASDQRYLVPEHVEPNTLQILQQPVSYVGRENDSVTFRVEAKGENLTYQWQFSDNGGKKWITSNVNSGIYTTKLTAARNGRLLRCTVKDGYGNTLTSDTVSMRLYQFAITSHPMDQVGLENDSLTFSITAQGDGLTYQWQYSDNGGAKWATSNVKTSTYTTRLYASRNGRLVRCIVTDAYGTALTSDAASMRLYELAITTQPVSCVANENDTVTFTVAAHGTGLVYQWQYSDNGGARWINSLVKTPVYTGKLTATRNGRLLRCIVSDAYGDSVISEIVSMKLYQLAITTQPTDCSALENATVTFHVAAAGDGLTYQWQYSDNGGAKWANSSVNTDTYTGKLTATRNGRLVRCIVTDAYGSTVISDSAVMKLYQLTITTQPVDCVRHENEEVTFTVAAQGDGLTYQWQYSDNDGATWRKSSVTNASYTAKLTAAKDGRLVRCIVTDAYGGTVTSDSACMKLYQLSITRQPQDYVGAENSVTNIFLEAEGEGLTYQWQFSDNGGKKWSSSSVDDPVYAARLTAAKDGRLVRCIVTDAYGDSVISKSARMKIYRLRITTQPVDCITTVNSMVTFFVSAEGEGLTYQWQYSDNNGTTWNISSVTTDTYTAKLTAAKNGRLVRCIVTDVYGSTVTSDAAKMKIYKLEITSQPRDYIGAAGSTATIPFSVEGAGLTYQWQYSDNGGKTWNDSSCTSAIYTARLTAAKNGRLVRCIVTDVNGDSVITRPAAMRIGPVITAQPQSYVGARGSKASFTIVAEGTGLTYQWEVSDDGGVTWTQSAITSDVYSVTLTTARDGRMFHCIVTDENDVSVTSEPVSMKIAD